MMEVYAAALSHADYQMGRILDTIEAQGELDNTLVIYIQGDNGASGEGGMQGLLNEMTVFNAIPEDMKEVVRRMDELGGPTTFNHYPVGWAHAMDTPFQWTKQIASHFGGTRNGMVISWPARIKDKGGLRTQFSSVIDIMPTILEAVGVPAPTSINGVVQKPIEGTSLVYTFDDAKAPSKHTTQYFEMFGNQGIYHDGWVPRRRRGCSVGHGRRGEGDCLRPRLQVGALQRQRGLLRGEHLAAKSRQAQGAAGPLLEGSREVQRAADRERQDHSFRCEHPA